MRLVASVTHLVRSRIVRFWHLIVGSSRGPAYRIVLVEGEPDVLRPKRLYVIEDAGVSWTAVMVCPGGCGQTLHMNLLPDSKPVWRLTQDERGLVTLRPSVWQREGCGCHFFLRKGKIEWC